VTSCQRKALGCISSILAKVPVRPASWSWRKP
jgi:hypothetical protein